MNNEITKVGEKYMYKGALYFRLEDAQYHKKVNEDPDIRAMLERQQDKFISEMSVLVKRDVKWEDVQKEYGVN